eukprot:1002429-Amphidinium_carterae.1
MASLLCCRRCSRCSLNIIIKEWLKRHWTGSWHRGSGLNRLCVRPFCRATLAAASVLMTGLDVQETAELLRE